MDIATLGKTGLQVSRLGMGGLFASADNGQGDAAVATLQRAYDLGVNYLDTAPSYGESESVLGKVFKETGRPPILSTKVGAKPPAFDPQNPDIIRTSIENSLQVMGLDCVDILMIHEPDRPGQNDWWTDMAAVEGPVLEVLGECKERGLIKHIGLGGTGVTEMHHLIRSGKFDVVLTAFNYSILYREAEELVISEAKRQGMGVVAGSPLQQGGLATKYDVIYDDSIYWLHPLRRQQFKDLYALCDELGMTIADMAVRFVVSNPNIDTLLMGARNVQEVEQNVASIETGPLPDDVLARLDEIAAVLPYRPYEEPSGMGYRLSSPGEYKGPGHVNY